MTFSQVRQYVTGLLRASFENKSELDKIGEDENGNLTYDGSAITPQGETITENDITTAIAADAASIWTDEEEEENNS